MSRALAIVVLLEPEEPCCSRCDLSTEDLAARVEAVLEDYGRVRLVEVHTDPSAVLPSETIEEHLTA